MRDVLRKLVAGELTEDEAVAQLRQLELDELGGRARLDLGRYLRRGIPEVVLAAGKSPREAARLVTAMAERQGQGLVSRMTDEHASAVADAASAAEMEVARYHSLTADPETVGSELRVTAWTDEGVIMGLRHGVYPIEGVQFHPESFMTEYGHAIIQNFFAGVTRHMSTGSRCADVASRAVR